MLLDIVRSEESKGLDELLERDLAQEENYHIECYDILHKKWVEVGKIGDIFLQTLHKDGIRSKEPSEFLFL